MGVMKYSNITLKSLTLDSGGVLLKRVPVGSVEGKVSSLLHVHLLCLALALSAIINTSFYKLLPRKAVYHG